jgi:hypothetical protein
MSALILGIATFFLHVLTLKLAVSSVGVPRSKNRYTKALFVVLGLSMAGFIVGFIPLFGWLIYSALWILVVMSAYNLGFAKSILVAVIQVGLKIALWLLLKLFGVSTLLSDQLTFGI